MANDRLPFRVVLLADSAPSRECIQLGQDDLECVEPEYLEEVSDTIANLCSALNVYESPKQFLENIRQHRSDVVLSIWSGRSSRNRKALVPSICEAYGITYVGADTYTNVLCQDKNLAKRFAKKYGFDSPNGQLVTGPSDLDLVQLLRPPLVVKPNFEGGSIGISRQSLVRTHHAAVALCTELLELFKQPILVEEFVEGREVSIVLADRNRMAPLAEVVELYIAGEPDALSRQLFSYELKKSTGDRDIVQRPITNEVSTTILQSAINLFVALGKVELLRVDGRYQEGQFHLIELSPDVHLGRDASVSIAFAAAGYSYADMLQLLLSNAWLNRGQ